MTRTLIAAAILGISLSGCSTARNLLPSEAHGSPPWKIYGGTVMACENLQGSHGHAASTVCVWPFATADIVASAVADTYTLPFTGAVAVCRLINHIYHHYYPPEMQWTEMPDGVPIITSEYPISPSP